MVKLYIFSIYSICVFCVYVLAKEMLYHQAPQRHFLYHHILGCVSAVRMFSYSAVLCLILITIQGVLRSLKASQICLVWKKTHEFSSCQRYLVNITLLYNQPSPKLFCTPFLNVAPYSKEDHKCINQEDFSITSVLLSEGSRFMIYMCFISPIHSNKAYSC